MISEPDILVKQNPELLFQKTIISFLQEELSHRNITFLIIEYFGLDLAVFFPQQSGLRTKFIELKAYCGSRRGGVGVGNKQGGTQIEILDNSSEELKTFNGSIIWALVDGTLEKGIERYCLLESQIIKNNMMGGVRKGKQNNLRIAALNNIYVNWETFCKQLVDFLIEI